jgi:hypothetical protein
VASALKMHECHDLNQMPDMQGVGGWVKTDIPSGYFFEECVFGSGHDVVDHAAPLEFYDKVAGHFILLIL